MDDYIECECGRCGQVKQCLYRKDPYLAEIHDKSVYSYWCDDCYDSRAYDI